MNIRPIRTEADYESALMRAENLMNAEVDTPEGDELELLSILIDQYEEQKFVIDAPSPIAAIKFRMEQGGLAPRDLEPYIGSKSRVSEVLSGERPLSMEMVRALKAHLGIPSDALIKREPLAQPEDFSEPPHSVTRRLVALRIKQKAESYRSFLERAFAGTPSAAMLRKTRTERTRAQTDTTSLQAWCAAAILISRDASVRQRFDKNNITDCFVRDLADLSLDPLGPTKVASKLAEVGIVFVVLKHFEGTHLDGAAMRRTDGVPIVALTLRRDRVDNFWFTLMHELAHVKKHLVDDWVIYDDLEVKSVEHREQEADRFAEDALISKEVWERWNLTAYASTSQILSCAKEASVHPAIVAGRWQLQFGEFRKFSKMLGHGAIQTLFGMKAE